MKTKRGTPLNGKGKEKRENYKVGKLNLHRFNPINMVVKPDHPGLVLATSLDANGISIPDFAKEIGLTLSELQTILNGRAPITETLAIRIGAYFGTGNGTHWIRQQTAYDEFYGIKNNTPQLNLAH